MGVDFGGTLNFAVIGTSSLLVFFSRCVQIEPLPIFNQRWTGCWSLIHDRNKTWSFLLFCVPWLKRLLAFPFPAGMSLTKLSLGGNSLIFPAQGEIGKRHPGCEQECR
jgi:hypothetical protein